MNIYLERRGGSGNGLIRFALFAHRKCDGYGHGTQYSFEGEPYTFGWVYAKDHKKLPDDLRKKFTYSFKHGSDGIDIPKEYINKDTTYEDVFELLRDNSKFSYKWVSRNDVAKQRRECEFLESIKTKEDFYKNVEAFDNISIPINFIHKIFKMFGLVPLSPDGGNVEHYVYDLHKLYHIITEVRRIKKYASITPTKPATKKNEALLNHPKLPI